MRYLYARTALAAGVCSLAVSAQAATLTAGTYQLANHPDGAVQPPPYGFRLDGLFTGNGGDEFTFNFEDSQSDMRMDLVGSGTSITQIHIYGVAYGGRDLGGAYADTSDPTWGSYTGVYQIDFTYNLGVGLATGDDDLIVDTANHANSGTIVAPDGTVIGLVDERGGNPFSFRLGDEDNDAGHRGYPGISGWGWVNHSGNGHIVSSDWLFTARPIPLPAPVMLGAVGLGGVAGIRRRRGV